MSATLELKLLSTGLKLSINKANIELGMTGRSNLVPVMFISALIQLVEDVVLYCIYQ